MTASSYYETAAVRMDDRAGTDLRIVAVCAVIAFAYAVVGDDGWDYVTAAVWSVCAALFVLSYRWHRRAAQYHREAAAVVAELARLRGDT